MPPAFVLSQDQTLRLKTGPSLPAVTGKQNLLNGNRHPRQSQKPKLEPCDSCVVFQDTLGMTVIVTRTGPPTPPPAHPFSKLFNCKRSVPHATAPQGNGLFIR